MPRSNFNDLIAFVAVARERSLTRAAARLGVSVTPTEAGNRLLRTVGPRFEKIESELTALGELRGKPAGAVRLTATE